MALKSMTGYGRGEASSDGVGVTVELSSVNRRQFDLRVNLPRGLTALESRLQSEVKKVVNRGCVTGSVRVTQGCSGPAVRIDEETAGAQLAMLRETGRRLGLTDDLTIRTLLQLPDVMVHYDATEDADRVWELLSKALHRALEGLAKMRKVEGRAHEKDIKERIVLLKELLGSIKHRVVGRSKDQAAKLKARVAKLDVEMGPDDPLLAKEIAILVDRSDISEEIVRMESHFKQASRQMRSKEPAGRGMDFLCQEMFREINTIGSKANDATISRLVIEFKACLETVREQVQNVE